MCAMNEIENGTVIMMGAVVGLGLFGVQSSRMLVNTVSWILLGGALVTAIAQLGDTGLVVAK